MKYLILLYSSPATWNALTQQERDQLAREHAELDTALADSGELLASEALTDPSHATAVRVRGGAAAITDGPYAEVKEHLAGFYLVDCDSPERVREIAVGLPDARVCGVEIRPVMDGGGMEM